MRADWIGRRLGRAIFVLVVAALTSGAGVAVANADIIWNRQPKPPTQAPTQPLPASPTAEPTPSAEEAATTVDIIWN